MTTIDRLHAGNSVSTNSTSVPVQETSLFNAYALISNFQDLLRKIMEEAAMQHSTTTAIDTSTAAHETGSDGNPGTLEETSGQPQPSSGNSPTSLTKALRDMLMTNANSQTLFAQLQATAAEGSTTFLQSQLQNITDTITQFQAAIQQQQDAETHKSFWQKFTDGFTEAINAAWNFEKKKFETAAGFVDKVLSYSISQCVGKQVNVHAAEDTVHFAEDDVEGIVKHAEGLVNYIKEGIHWVMESPALLLEVTANGIAKLASILSGKDIDIDQDKLKLACEIVAAVIITVLVTVLTAGAGTAEEVGEEIAEEGVELTTFSSNQGALEGEAAEGTANAGGDAAAGSNGMSSLSRSAANILSKVKSVMRANAWSSRIFALTFNLQNTDFAQNVAKQCTDDPSKQAIIAGAINAGLSIASGIAGFGLVSSAFNSANGLYTMTNRLQLLNQLMQLPGQVGTAKWDFRLAAITKEMGNIQAALSTSEGLAQSTEAELNNADDFFASFMKSVTDNISSIAQIIPMASKAEADALNEAHGA